MSEAGEIETVRVYARVAVEPCSVDVQHGFVGAQLARLDDLILRTAPAPLLDFDATLEQPSGDQQRDSIPLDAQSLITAHSMSRKRVIHEFQRAYTPRRELVQQIGRASCRERV